MIKRFIKALAFLVLVLVLVIPSAALLVDDETLSSAIEGMPIIGGYSENILNSKQRISITLAEYVGGALNTLETLYFDVLGFSASPQTQKVVMELAPPAPAGDLTPPPSPEGRGRSAATGGQEGRKK